VPSNVKVVFEGKIPSPVEMVPKNSGFFGGGGLRRNFRYWFRDPQKAQRRLTYFCIKIGARVSAVPFSRTRKIAESLCTDANFGDHRWRVFLGGEVKFHPFPLTIVRVCDWWKIVTPTVVFASCQLKSCQLPRNSAETTCTTSRREIEDIKLDGYCGAMCNKHVHSTMMRSTCFHCLRGVINKPTTVEFCVLPVFSKFTM